jgi:hypothetical protein
MPGDHPFLRRRAGSGFLSRRCCWWAHFVMSLEGFIGGLDFKPLPIISGWNAVICFFFFLSVLGF